MACAARIASTVTGAGNNKICFIDITPVGAGGGAATISTPAIDPDAPISLSWPERSADGLTTLRVDGLEGASYDIEVSSDLKTWETLGTTPAIDGSVTFEDEDRGTSPQSFCRVRRLEKTGKSQ